MGKITAKPVTEKVCKDIHVLITQTEDDVPVLRRIPASTLFDALGVNGLRYEGNLLTLTTNGVEKGNTVEIVGGSGGGGTGSTITLVNKMASRTLTVISSATTYPMLVNCVSTDNSTGEDTGNLSATWMVNNVRVAVQSIPQGDYSFDIRRYLTDGSTNTVRLTIEDSYGNSKPFSWDITVSAFALTWNMDVLAYHASNKASIRLVPVGSGTKTVHVALDGTEIYTEEVSISGRTVSVDVDAQSHGAHTVTAWLTATLDGISLTTEPLTHVGIWSEADFSAPIIAVATPNFTVPQYATYNIQWMVYDPQNEVAEVIQSANGTVQNVVSADRSIQTWAYRPEAVGTDNLSLACGATTAQIVGTITSLGYDIQEVGGAEIDIDPTGHSNTETGRENFGYTDETGVIHPFTFSDNFDWNNGGFQIDEDGITAFVVRRGTYVTLDRSLFSDNAKTTGKEIKAIFKSVNVRDYDSTIMSCVSGGIGLEVKAEATVLTSSLESRSVQYCIDRKIELDVNIESAGSLDNRLAMMWLNGIPSRVFAYSADDSWTQSTPSSLVIGSADCDIWLYRLKMYPYNLTKYEILDNFIADCADPYEMIDRYKRNDIYSESGSIDMNKLANAKPELRVLNISADRMTTGKKDEVSCKFQHVFRSGGDAHCWIAYNAIYKGQGTSSLDYGKAALNLDVDLKGATWTNNAGETMTEYAMTENSIPVYYFNIKLNVASSENANNDVLADNYNEFQPWLSAARREDPRVRDTVEGHPCVVFFTNTSSDTITVGSHTVAPGQTILYGCGDMNNSKKNTQVFGQDNEKWPKQCCIEILNNNNPQCKFQSDDLSNEGWGANDGDSFEFRYGGTDEHKSLLKKLLTWTASTNTAAATGAAFSAPQVIDGVTYANDTATYRGAKFKAELSNWFNVDSLLYHYIYTEHMCMVDNRAKNTFLSYEYDPDLDDYRWNFTKDYDNDTGLGNDNSGGMTFPYGKEDTDSIGAAKVFNASDHVIWCNIRDYMFSELQAEAQRCETVGAFDADRLDAKFKAHQTARPEALVAEDMFGKYIDPYLTFGETRYFEMLFGNKTDQRYGFLVKQNLYMATKYMTTRATKDSIEFRCNTPSDYVGVAPSGDVDVVPAMDMYIIGKYGNAGTIRIRVSKGVATRIKCPTTSLEDTETYFYPASKIAALKGLAGLYTKIAVLSSATMLQYLELGSGETGYSNTVMTSISFGNNAMLEYIDLRGLVNLNQNLDLTGLTSLKTLLATNSGITGVSFAIGAPVVTAKMPALKNLNARQLAALETFTMDATKLETVRVEGSPAINTYSLVAAATGLLKGRLTDVSWTSADPDVMLLLAGLSGMDSNGNDASRFILTGTANIPSLTEDELTLLVDGFPDLMITYDAIVSAYTVTFQNDDGTFFEQQTVREGGAAVNPVTAGHIPTPVKEPTVEETFTYIGWDKSFSNIIEDTVVTAVYSALVRKYCVNWWLDQAESVLKKTATVEAHGKVEWDGGTLTSSDGSLWMGWDAPTTDVVSDMDVHAVFITPVLPDAVAVDYDFLYSDNPADKSGYTLAELCGIIKAGREQEYFSPKDKIKVTPNTNVFADTEIHCVVSDFNHSRLADGSNKLARVEWDMLGLMNATRQMNSSNTNAGGWDAAAMRTFLNEKVYPAMPLWFRTIVPKVQVRTSKGGTSAEIVISEDYLYLRSAAEVGFDTGAVPYVNEVDPEADHIALPIYTDNASRIKKTYNGSGAANLWWLRSPDASSTTNFRSVNSYGSSYSYNAINANGVSWGFATNL